MTGIESADCYKAPLTASDFEFWGLV